MHAQASSTARCIVCAGRAERLLQVRWGCSILVSSCCRRCRACRLLECIKFMIQERQQDAAVRDSSACSLTHSKSAPSPMSLLKPLPPRPAPPQAPGGRESGRDSSSGSLSAVVLGASNGFQQLQDGDSSAQLPPAGYSGQQQQDGAAGGTAASTGGGVHPRQALVPGSSPSAGAEWTATTPKPEHSWFV